VGWTWQIAATLIEEDKALLPAGDELLASSGKRCLPQLAN
jgi:hypothetical protein